MPNGLRVDVAAGVLRVRLAGEMLLEARGEVLLSDGRALQCSGWTIEHIDTGVIVRLRYRNDTTGATGVEQLRPLVAHNGFRGALLSALLVYQCGWQSWSRSHPSAPFESNLESAGPPIRGPYLPHRRPDSQIEPWMTILSSGGVSLLLGFVSGSEQQSTIEIAPEARGGHSVRAAVELDGVSLKHAREVVSEPLLVAVGTESELLECYARETARRMSARPRDDVLTGWCSWYQLYTTLSEADVDRNLASLARQRERVPLKLIQLDDGYQHEVGDWLQLNEKFPAGMPAVVQRVTQQGYMPGLWLAPFIVSARSNTYTAHPDWVVRDERGDPVNALHNWGAANYAVDTTHPEVLAWLERVIRTVCDDWGYAYLKLDFLYAGAMRGQRYDRSVTAIQAYRRGLELMRRAAGDRFILGCGAPLVPSIGLVDGMRIGSDVAAFWGGEGNSDGPSMRNATRATLARLWMHGRWWTNDPDCVVIRASDTELSLAEVQGWLSAVALSGGMLFIGDDVSRVDSDRLDMLARLIPPSGRAAVASGPLVQSIPERLVLHVDGCTVVGLANWSDAPAFRVLRIPELGLPPAAYHVLDLWTGDYLGRTSDALDLGTVAAHGMRLLSLHADLGRPRTIGSTGHLLGDAMDLTSEEWDVHAHELTLHAASGGPTARRAEFIVFDPSGPIRRVPFSAGESVRVRFV